MLPESYVRSGILSAGVKAKVEPCVTSATKGPHPTVDDSSGAAGGGGATAKVGEERAAEVSDKYPKYEISRIIADKERITRLFKEKKHRKALTELQRNDYLIDDWFFLSISLESCCFAGYWEGVRFILSQSELRAPGKSFILPTSSLASCLRNLLYNKSLTPDHKARVFNIFTGDRHQANEAGEDFLVGISLFGLENGSLLRIAASKGLHLVVDVILKQAEISMIKKYGDFPASTIFEGAYKYALKGGDRQTIEVFRKYHDHFIPRASAKKTAGPTTWFGRRSRKVKDFSGSASAAPVQERMVDGDEGEGEGEAIVPFTCTLGASLDIEPLLSTPKEASAISTSFAAPPELREQHVARQQGMFLAEEAEARKRAQAKDLLKSAGTCDGDLKDGVAGKTDGSPERSAFMRFLCCCCPC